MVEGALFHELSRIATEAAGFHVSVEHIVKDFESNRAAPILVAFAWLSCPRRVQLLSAATGIGKPWSLSAMAWDVGKSFRELSLAWAWHPGMGIG